MAKTAIPKSKAKTAYGLLSSIEKLILEEPRRYRQSSWRLAVDEMHNKRLAPACGTVGCVAGWVDVLKNPIPFDVHVANDIGWSLDRGVGGFAREVLGLDEFQAAELFNSDAAGSHWDNEMTTTRASLRAHARRGAKHIAKFQKKYAAQLKAKRV